MMARPFVVAGAVVAYIAVAAVLALWAGGALFFLMHRAIPHHVTPLTWPTYAHFYWNHSRERQLLLLSLLVPAAVGLFPLGALLSWLGGADRELHGSARFASPADVRRSGLTGKIGIIVGKMDDHFLQFPGQQFVLLAAPTRSGKGVSVVVPNLLNWSHSAVVLDIKLENFLLTSKFRASHGQDVYLFNPYAEDGRTHRWNPLDAISRDPNIRVGDLLAMAGMLYPASAGDKDAFWSDTAKNLFLGLALMVMETPNVTLTMGEILRQSSGKGRGLKEYLADEINARAAREQAFSGDCLEALNRFMSATDNTLANIINSFTAPLVAFANPLVDAATAASDFDMAKVRDQKMTIYIGIQPNRLADAALLLNLFFSQLIHVNTKALPAKGLHDIPCLLILDEFPALGKIRIMTSANAFIAGYGLRLLTIVQSVAQLETVYGPKEARTLITNHAMQILFTPREQADANSYSEMLGYYTVKSTSKGRSTNRGFAGGGSSSENVSDQRRALLLPQELKELSDEEQIIILEGARPIRCGKGRYYQEPAFIDRLKTVSPSLARTKGLPTRDALDLAAFTQRELSIAVPHLDVDQHVARVEGRTRPLTIDDQIDVNALDLPIDTLPSFDDPGQPTPAELGGFVGSFLALAGAEAGPIALLTVAEESNMLMEA